MKKTLIALMCILTVLFTAMGVASCNTTVQNTKELQSIEVVNLPEQAIFVGEFDQAGIKLKLNYSDSTFDEISVTEEILPTEYQTLVNTPGEHLIEMLYRGKEVSFTVKVRASGIFVVRFLKFDTVVKTVTYDANSPSEIVPPTQEEMAVEGYRFTGFDKAFDNITADTDIHGEYVKTWTVKFYNKNNQLISAQVIDNGLGATAPTAAQMAVEGYRFIGFDKAFDNITADTDIHGEYVKTWTVRFYNKNNQLISTQVIDNGLGATAPTAAQMAVEGYRFTGFDKAFDNITADTDIHGEYVKTWTVTFYNGRSEVISTQTVDNGSSATEPTEEQKAMSGYIWKYWDNAFTNITQDTLVYGVYVKGYVLTYSSEDTLKGTVSGNVNSGALLANGATVQLVATAKAGYVFNGWYNGDDLVCSTEEYSFIMSANAIELIARFRQSCEVYGHSLTDWIVDQEATCTEQGLQHKDCSVCNTTIITSVIPSKGHSMYSEIVNEATCTENGLTRYSCYNCNYSYDITTYAEHNFEESERVEATCTEDGYITYSCTNANCDEEYTQTITGGHEYEVEETVQPIKAQDGYVKYTCVKCGDTYTEAIEALGESGYVLLVQDRVPWTVDNGVSLLKRLTENGYISGWSITTASNFNNVDLSGYDVIYVANDQTTATYNILGSLNDSLTQFASSCGVVVYGACDHGWAAGNISYNLPGGVTRSTYYSRYNYIVDFEHAIVTGALTDGNGISNYLLQGTYCSHSGFVQNTLPEGTNVILEDGKGLPSLIEYSLGNGTVIASGLTWEFYYTRPFVGDTTYSKNVFDDLIVYAMSLVNTCDHVYGEGTVVEPTCTHKGYTEYTCTECGYTVRSDYTDKTELVFVEGTPATCTSSGTLDYWYCPTCQKTFADSEAITQITDIVDPQKNHVPGGYDFDSSEHWNICTLGCQTKLNIQSHTYGSPTWSWGGTDSATALFTCVCTHSFTLNATITNVTNEATCTQSGSVVYTATVVYNNQEYTSTQTIVLDALGHDYQNNVCSRCGDTLSDTDLYTRVDEDGNEDENGTHILFGSYPQTAVTDSTTVTTLNGKLTEGLPTSADSNGWTDYGYYISGSVQSYMWYIDLYDGVNRYRGVYFTSYRPYYTTNSSSEGNTTYQDNNGYSLSTVYWFKWEPIMWEILDEETGLVLCEMIIDSQEYYDNYNNRTINGTTVYANNYEYSNIRSWLNDNFYNTAFSELQQNIIIEETVKNDYTTTSAPDNKDHPYTCNNTEDYVFLLSYQDMLNSNYGFSTSYSEYDTARQKKTTAYAQSQGAWTSTSSDYLGNGCWWLRSPSSGGNNYAYYVNFSGIVDYFNLVYNTSNGVVPALRIAL